MNILLNFKKNKTVNAVIRSILKRSSNSSKNFFLFLIKRWTISGVVDCGFNKYNFKYFSNCDDGIPNYFFYDLKYSEKADLELFLKLAENSNTIIDIGANTGVYSVLASKANPHSKIFSFEPYNSNAERMQLNLDLNSVTNVAIINSALGDSNGEIEIAVPENKSISDVSSVNKEFSKTFYPGLEWGTQKVKIQKLDSFADENNLTIDLIKCDVETYEMAVFNGMEKIMEIQKPTIIFESFFDNEREIFFNQILKKHNYFLYLILEQGIVYCKEGFVPSKFSLNYLITPVKPSKTFIEYSDSNELCQALLLRN